MSTSDWNASHSVCLRVWYQTEKLVCPTGTRVPAMQSVLVCGIRLKINSDVTMSNIDWSASHSVCLAAGIGLKIKSDASMSSWDWKASHSVCHGVCGIRLKLMHMPVCPTETGVPAIQSVLGYCVRRLLPIRSLYW